MNFLKSFTAALLLAAAPLKFSLAQNPGPQPRPAPPQESCLYNLDGTTKGCQAGQTTTVVTPGGPPIYPAGVSNLLTTVFADNVTDIGNRVLNTVPSTPTVPYNLIDGPVTHTAIDSTSPTDDMTALLRKIHDAAQKGQVDQASIKFAIDILEGNPLPVPRAYDGLPLLHYNGPAKTKFVQPVYDNSFRVVGGNINVHQVWYDSHIESDTAFINPSAVWDVPWEITYTVDVLHRGDDDFAPFVMYFSDPKSFGVPGGVPLTAMDQTFFPILEGQRYVFHIKMAQGKYLSLIYTWGWRRHPPRIQVMENSLKRVGGKPIADWESDTFGKCPRCSRAEQLHAISEIAELAPEKRMWQDLLNAQVADPDRAVKFIEDAQLSLDDWKDRTHLPRGVDPDPDPSVNATLFFANNTIYGNVVTFPEWVNRSPQDSPTAQLTTYKATLLNGDHFIHSYGTVDFGGARGWENTFQSTLKDGGSGCYFTFGRDHWTITAGVSDANGLINIPAADYTGQSPGIWHLNLTLNFDPNPRLRLYQFDPIHHDEAIYSLH